MAVALGRCAGHRHPRVPRVPVRPAEVSDATWWPPATRLAVGPDGGMVADADPVSHRTVRCFASDARSLASATGVTVWYTGGMTEQVRFTDGGECDSPWPEIKIPRGDSRVKFAWASECVTTAQVSWVLQDRDGKSGCSALSPVADIVGKCVHVEMFVRSADGGVFDLRRRSESPEDTMVGDAVVVLPVLVFPSDCGFDLPPADALRCFVAKVMRIRTKSSVDINAAIVAMLEMDHGKLVEIWRESCAAQEQRK